jgi:Fe-S cluster assembly protein SufD
MTLAMREQNAYVAQFARLEKEAAGGRRSWVQRLREEALERFAELGFPTTRDEEWRQTNVEPIARTGFHPAARRLDGIAPRDLARFTFGNLSCAQLVFLNGTFAPQLSSLGALPRGVRAGNLESALEADRVLIEPHLARYASHSDHAFRALNTAFLRDGAFLHVPRGTVLEAPIQLLFISAARGEKTHSHPRNLILVDDDSQVTILETYAGLGKDVYFTNAVTELVVGSGAVVEHYKLQRESDHAYHVATFQAHIARGGNLTDHSFSLGGALARNDVNAVLAGEGAECTLNGLFLATGQQHVDNHTRIDHAKPRGTSREFYKGVLAEKSHAVFNGRIIVRPDAQKTDSKQTNRNLLLSEEALIDTRPQLEIYADDVKCTHGATIGQLDEEALFYLRARGIDAKAAHALLIQAFASDVTHRVRLEPVRAQLDRLVHQWLPQTRHMELVQ